jgi:hypothetical protein
MDIFCAWACQRVDIEARIGVNTQAPAGVAGRARCIRGADQGGPNNVTAQLTTIGLDVAEMMLSADWAEGISLARPYALGTGWNLPADIPPGARWPRINSGRSIARFGLSRHPRQLRPGEVDCRFTNEA